MNITANGWIYEIEVTRYEKTLARDDEQQDLLLEFNVLSIHPVDSNNNDVDDILSDDDLAGKIFNMSNYDEFHAHEVIDRLHIANCMLDQMFTNHPFVKAHPEVKALIEEVEDKISEAYQKASSAADKDA